MKRLPGFLAAATLLSLAFATAAFAQQAPTAAQAPGIALPVAVLERYVSEWATPGGMTVTFRRDGERLFVKPGTNPEVPLNARSETRLQDPRGPVFEFQLDGQGRVTGANVEQGPNRIPLQRK